VTKGVYSALSGAVAASVQLDTTAQNLANASTAGYQRLRPLFREALAGAAGRNEPGSPRFAAPAGTVIDLSPGVIRTTGRALDVVPPEGTFLAVSTPRGERYTRSGAIEQSASGELRLGGHPLLNEKGEPIAVDPAKLASISEDGQVLVDGEGLARIKLVSFREPAALTPEGAVLFSSSTTSGPAEVTNGTLRVGELEDSNSTPVVAMTELMTTSRLFDAYQRAIDTFRDADRRIAKIPET
jgi:flagellar basal body rod protein FlgG